MPDLRIGISGWLYPPWRGTFYPKGLPQRSELEYASRQVNSVEINGTFYSLQHLSSFKAWAAATPEDFVFSIKGSRFLTHMKRLKNIEVPLANFFGSGILALGKKLGPFLWQIPPNFAFEAARFENFFRMLPRDCLATADLAAAADRKIVPMPSTEVAENFPLRHCLEVRHESFLRPEAIELLRAHNIGMVVADTAGKWPFIEDLTSDFVYVRLHGDAQLYVSGYSDVALENWARKIRAWQAGDDPPEAKRIAAPQLHREGGRAVYAYFDNDVKTRAPFDAMSLAHKLGLAPPPAWNGPAPHEVSEEPRTNWPGYAKKKKAVKLGADLRDAQTGKLAPAIKDKALSNQRSRRSHPTS